MYSALDSQKKEIRLLEILPDSNNGLKCILHKARYDVDDFCALSYTWGDPNVTQKITIGDQEVVDVTTNLYTALIQIRQRQIQKKTAAEEPRLVWADALCINQADMKERREQVSMMGDIYTAASTVLVWLGPEVERTQNAFEHFKQWQEFLELEAFTYPVDPMLFVNTLWPRPDVVALLGLMELFGQRKWWTRVWTLQEIVLAKNAVILCGKHEIEWVALSRILRTWVSSASARVIDALQHQGGFYGGENYPWLIVKTLLEIDVMEIITTKESLEERGPGLMNTFEWIHVTERRDCFDSRDKVFGLLGLSPTGLQLKPDYDTAADGIYTEAYKSIITKTNTLEVLALAGIGTKSEPFETAMEAKDAANASTTLKDEVAQRWQRRNLRTANNPSWVRDFAWVRSSQDSDGNYNIQKVLKAWPEHIHAAGKVIDDVVAEFPSDKPHMAKFRGVRCGGIVAEVEGLVVGESIEQSLWRYRQLARRTRWPSDNLPAFFAAFTKSQMFPLLSYDSLLSMSPLGAFFRTLILLASDDLNSGLMQENLNQAPGVAALQLIMGYCKTLLDARDVVNMDERLEKVTGDSHDLVASLFGDQGLNAVPAGFERDDAGRERMKSIVKSHDAMFSTAEGYIGSGPAGMLPGDQVCILYNCPCPLVIRRIQHEDEGHDQFQLVGPCFVYGMMRGEMLLSEKQDEWLEFI